MYNCKKLKKFLSIRSHRKMCPDCKSGTLKRDKSEPCYFCCSKCGSEFFNLTKQELEEGKIVVVNNKDLVIVGSKYEQ